MLWLDVSLPPGSDKGPRILRRVLRRLGARSYPQWRAWLALAYLWDRSAVNGHWVRATRPRLARDSGGAGPGPAVDRPALRAAGRVSSPAFRIGVAVPSATWIPGRTRRPVRGVGGLWIGDASRYPVFSARDRRRIAFGPESTHRPGGIDDAWHKSADAAGVVILDTEAVDRDGKRGSQTGRLGRVGGRSLAPRAARFASAASAGTTEPATAPSPRYRLGCPCVRRAATQQAWKVSGAAN